MDSGSPMSTPPASSPSGPTNWSGMLVKHSPSTAATSQEPRPRQFQPWSNQYRPPRCRRLNTCSASGSYQARRVTRPRIMTIIQGAVKVMISDANVDTLCTTSNANRPRKISPMDTTPISTVACTRLTAAGRCWRSPARCRRARWCRWTCHRSPRAAPAARSTRPARRRAGRRRSSGPRRSTPGPGSAITLAVASPNTNGSRVASWARNAAAMHRTFGVSARDVAGPVAEEGAERDRVGQHDQRRSR